MSGPASTGAGRVLPDPVARERSPTARHVRTLLDRALKAGQLSCAVAAWQSDQDLEPSEVAVGRTSVLAGPDAPPVGPSSWFDLASLTKPLVTTTLVLQAARKGRPGPELHLDDLLEDHLPEARRSAFARASLIHLLSHSSGLPAWLPLYVHARQRSQD
jgi:CubicO group peptidase (beta-lactamase class C family)